MRRFYHPTLSADLKDAILKDAHEIHHVRDVLRLTVGDSMILFNGGGLEAEADIVSMTSGTIHVLIKEIKMIPKQSPKLILACAVPKRGKFELIIEKATELGVDEIIPVITERTEVVIKEEGRAIKKQDRFQSIAVNAAKQCKRSTIPVVRQPLKMKNCLTDLIQRSTVLIPSLMGEPASLMETFQKIGRPEAIAFFIGPEGDFTPQEYSLAFEMGAKAVSLGPLVLKVETAAICALSCANVYYFA